MDKNNKPKKPWYKRVWAWIGIVAVLAIIGGIVGPKDQATKVDDNSTSKSSEKTVFKPGDVIEFDDKKVTVAIAERNWSTGNEYVVPQSNNEFVKIQVTIENNSNSEAPYNSFDWKLQDSKGVIKDVASVAFSVDGALNSGNLAPKGKVSGFLVFEVPAGDTGLTLRYNPSFWSNKKVEIKL